MDKIVLNLETKGEEEGHQEAAAQHDSLEEGHQEAAAQHDSLEDKGRVVYLWVFQLYLFLSQTYFSTDLNNIQSSGVGPNRQKPQF